VPDSERYKRVVVEGTYDATAEVAILNRSRDGAPGAWVLTPLVQADGTAVPVVRGWIPYDPVAANAAPFPDSVPPEGPVRVTGNLQPTQERGSFGSSDDDAGTLRAWVLLDAQDPPQPGGLPATIELQTTDPSQNFSYMMQWWIFALIALAGYPLVLRVVARNKAKGDQTPEDLDGGPGRDEIPWAPGVGPATEHESVSTDPS
jgi:cytochrome oxidase assembly protein ShyY1